jgi:hypothetical protein
VSHFLLLKNGDLKVVIQLSGSFVYPDDVAGDQSVWINEVRLYRHFLFVYTMHALLIINVSMNTVLSISNELGVCT